VATQIFSVVGMTCEHCVRAVEEELGALPGVTGVDVDLVEGGASSVQITGGHALSALQVARALDEAGDYRLS
jgi:copper chaperone